MPEVQSATLRVAGAGLVGPVAVAVTEVGRSTKKSYVSSFFSCAACVQSFSSLSREVSWRLASKWRRRWRCGEWGRVVMNGAKLDVKRYRPHAMGWR